MSIHSKVGSIDGYLGESTTRSGGLGLIKHSVTEILIHQGDILFVIVQCECLEPIDFLSGLEKIEFNFQGRSRGILRSEETLLAQADLLESHSVDGHFRRDILIRSGRG